MPELVSERRRTSEMERWADTIVTGILTATATGVLL